MKNITAIASALALSVFALKCDNGVGYSVRPVSAQPAVVQTSNELRLQIISGDYNGNGVVDAADYTLWRNTRNQFVEAGAGADGDRDGRIGQADYFIWKRFFGQRIVRTAGSGAVLATATSGGAQSIPEPTGALLLILAGFSLLSVARRRPV